MKFDTLGQSIEAYRNSWTHISRVDYDRRAALAIQHGIVERISAKRWKPDIGKYLFESLENLKHRKFLDSSIIIQEILKPAINLGLKVRAPTNLEDIFYIEAFFGVTQSIKEGVASIGIYMREARQHYGLGETELQRVPILEGVEIKSTLLPKAYRRAGVWVGWIEYALKNGEPTGNFEPAGCLRY